MENITQGQHDFTIIFRNKFATLSYNPALTLLNCYAESEYIPIDEFKKIFLFVSDFIETSNVLHFVFDKSNLRTFHQPSMEWYFAIWKPSLKQKGLLNHYKILPKLEWFEKAVEAGKHEIYQKYGTDILHGINISYKNTVIDVIKEIENSDGNKI